MAWPDGSAVHGQSYDEGTLYIAVIDAATWSILADFPRDGARRC
jgi:hypothetical protein